MSLNQYSRKYNMALMREKLSSIGILFAPASDGKLPVTSASRKAFLGDASPLHACMSKEKDWLACYTTVAMPLWYASTNSVQWKRVRNAVFRRFSRAMPKWQTRSEPWTTEAVWR